MIKSIEEIRKIVNTSPDYNFLHENPHLNNNIVFLGLGGSYAYGLAKETSDIDIRGIALRSKEEILLGRDFETVVNTNTDTTVYSLDKICQLLLACNPNVVEIFGLNLNQYVYANIEFMKEFISLKDAFLSKKCINSFGGYAQSQLRRLSNKAARDVAQKEREQHILSSINYAEIDYKTKASYADSNSTFKLYVDKAVTPDNDYEIFIDTNVKHYPLREYLNYLNTYHGVVRDYDKGDSKRNRKAVEHEKLDKHSTHLIRLYYMVFDILEHHEVITYRAKEHDFLMKLRNGLYIVDNQQPKQELFDLVDKLEDKFNKLIKTTTLPNEPDYDTVYKWLASVNERIISGKIYNNFEIGV